MIGNKINNIASQQTNFEIWRMGKVHLEDQEGSGKIIFRVGL